MLICQLNLLFWEAFLSPILFTHYFERLLTAIIEKEGNSYVALCPEIDVASQGDTVEEAKKNLKEAVELFFECASEEEIKERLHDEVFITRLDVAID